MRMSPRPAVLIAAFAALLACGGKQTQNTDKPVLENQGAIATSPPASAETRERTPALPPIPDAPQPAPDTLLAVVAVDNPVTHLGAAGRYADVIQPGASAMLDPAMLGNVLGNMVGIDGLSGLDMQKPLRVLVLSPKRSDDPIAIVGYVSDEKALMNSISANKEVMVQIHGGAAIIGSRAVLADSAPYALTTLVAEAAPAYPTMTVRIPALMSAYEDEISTAMSLMFSQAQSDPTMAQAKATADALYALVFQSESVRLSLELVGVAATGKLTMVPRAGTSLATLASQQPAAEFSMLDQVSPGTVFMAGHLTPSLQKAIEQLGQVGVDQHYGAEVGAKLMDVFRAFYQTMDGEMAMSGDISPKGGVWMEGLWGVNDAAKLNKAYSAAIAGLPKTPAADAMFTIKPAKAPAHRGVKPSGMTVSMNKDAPAEVRTQLEAYLGKGGFTSIIAAFDNVAVSTAGKDSHKRFKSMVDAVKGKKKSTIAPGAAGVLADARARSESMVMAVDLASILGNLGKLPAPAGGGDWAVFGLSFPDSTLSIRFTLPASYVKMMASMASSMGSP